MQITRIHYNPCLFSLRNFCPVWPPIVQDNFCNIGSWVWLTLSGLLRSAIGRTLNKTLLPTLLLNLTNIGYKWCWDGCALREFCFHVHCLILRKSVRPNDTILNVARTKDAIPRCGNTFWIHVRWSKEKNRTFHNDKLHNYYLYSNIFSGWMKKRWNWQVAGLEKVRIAHEILVRKSRGKRPIGRGGPTWEDKIKMRRGFSWLIIGSSSVYLWSQ